MPVAAKHSISFHEMSHQISALHLDHNHDDDHYEVPTLDESLFDQIAQLMQRVKAYEREEAEAKKSIELLSQALEAGNEIVAKAEEKREALIRKNRYLEGKLYDRTKNIESAVEYWRGYGVDVKQIHQNGDPYEQYEFIFANLNRRRKRQKSVGQSPDLNPLIVQENPNPDANTTPSTKHQQAACSVSLKYQDKKLEIVGQVPAILSAESLTLLNGKLTHHCVNPTNGHVNYRSAMTLIRKDLIKDSPSSKSS